MSYFCEVWFPGKAAAVFRHMANTEDIDGYFPHITLVRPFDVRNGNSEDTVRKAIVDQCGIQPPIKFSLEDKGSFVNETKVVYVPVYGLELLNFANKLEESLEPYVNFAPKFTKQKKLHLTIKTDADIEPYPRADYLMLRLIVLKAKLLWFAYDLAEQRVLERQEAKLTREQSVRKI